MDIRYKVLKVGDEHVLLNVAPDVFDHPVQPDLAKAYLLEPNYVLIVALDGDLVVGMATGFRYFHPDKPNEFFINEVGVDDAYLRQGIATQLMNLMFSEAEKLGCTGSWLATELDNEPARGLYRQLKGMEETIVYYGWGDAAV